MIALTFVSLLLLAVVVDDAAAAAVLALCLSLPRT